MRLSKSPSPPPSLAAPLLAVGRLDGHRHLQGLGQGEDRLHRDRQRTSLVASYDPNAATATTATGTVTVACTKNTAYNDAPQVRQRLDSSTGPPASSSVRDLPGRDHDAWTPPLWAATVRRQGPRRPTSPPSRIAAGQDVPVGTYTDTVTVNVTY